MCRLGPVRVVSLCCLFTLVALRVGRAQQALPVPTPGEAKIWQALDEQTELDFNEQPLSDVVDFLKHRHALDIQVDQRALQDVGLGSDTPMTRVLKNLSLRSALRLMLGEFELTYIVRDGYLLITSKIEAENMLTTKVYPVADLVTAKSDFQPPARGPRRSDTYRALIQIVRGTIAPDTWDAVGGPGTIEAFPNGEAIVVSQTTDVHEEIAELLAALRKTRDKQRAVAAAIVRQPQQAEDAVPKMRVKVYRLLPGGLGIGMGGRGMMGGGMGGGLRGGMGMMSKKDVEAVVSDPVADQKPRAANEAAPEEPAEEENASAGKPDNSSQKPEKPAPRTAPAAAPAFDSTQLDEWAAAIARLLPELIEPESWEPGGNGVARAAAGTIIIRQTDDIHEEIADLLGQIVAYHVAPHAGPSREAVLPALATPGPQANWPQEAEPRAAGAAAEIEQALDAVAEFDLIQQPLANLVKMLGEQYGIQVQLDQRALEDTGLGSDTPITLQIHGVSLREALRLMLSELELTYVIRNEVLVITSKTEAENMLVTKVYPVFDLVVCSGDDGHERSELDYHSLVNLIKTTIAPDTWDDVGGPGGNMSFANAGAVVISQTAQVHEEIAQHLRSLRDAAAQAKGD